MVDGPDAGIRALESLRGEASLARYHLLPAALGALHLRAGRPSEAARHYRDALSLPCSAPERRFLERQIAACEPPTDAAPPDPSPGITPSPTIDP